MQADNYKPDEQFTNRGWEDMHKMLDKEMPVERKKRRGLIWFYFLGTLILAGSFWFYNHKKSKTMAIEAAQKIYAEVEEELNQKSNQNQKLENINNDNNSTLDKGLRTNDKAILNSTKSSKKSRDKWDYSYTNTTKTLSESNSTIISTSDINTLKENQKLSAGTTPSARTDSNTSIASRTPLTMNSISFLDFYLKEKERNNPIIEIDELDGNKAEVVEKVQPQKREIEWGVNVGGLLDMENDQKLGGFVGANIHFPLNSKFGIKTGLGYSIINKDLNYQYSDNQDVLYIDPNEITVGSPAPVSTGNYIGVNTQTIFNLKRFHYLDVPVLFTYTLREKLEFQLGVNASFLIKDELTSLESAFYFEDETEADNLGIELAAVQEESVDLAKFQELDYWNKFNMSAVLGVSVKLNSHWNIGLQYHRGFSRFLQTNEEGIYADTHSSSGNFDPSAFTNNVNVPYNIRNDLSEGTFNSSSKIKDLNINHSLRLAIGYNF